MGKRHEESNQQEGSSLACSLQKPVVQSSIKCRLSQLVSRQNMKFLLFRYIEAGCWTVADKKETVTTSVTSKAVQIVIKLALIALGLDLDPGGFFGQCLADYKINIGLILAKGGLSAPAVVAEDKIDHRFKIFPVQLSDHLSG